MKIPPLLISIVSAGCAGGGENIVATVDSGWFGYLRAKRANRGLFVIEAGKTVATGAPVS